MNRIMTCRLIDEFWLQDLRQLGQGGGWEIGIVMQKLAKLIKSEKAIHHGIDVDEFHKVSEWHGAV